MKKYYFACILVLFSVEIASGAFSEINPGTLTGVEYSAVVLGDIDNDSDVDMIISGTDGTTYTSKIYQNNGSGSFTEIHAGSLQAVSRGALVLGDIDNDGDLDLILSGSRFDDIWYYFSIIYQNDGAGSFTEINPATLIGVGECALSLGDIDEDGDPDLILSGYNGLLPVRIYENNGTGSFAIVDNLAWSYRASSSLGDIDNDGDLDLILTGCVNGPDQFTKIYQNDGTGSFVEINPGTLTGVSSGSTAFGDLDDDGDLDMILTGRYSDGPVSHYVAEIYENDGSGSFTEINAGTLTGVNSSSVALGDIDNDGDLDLVLTGYSSGSAYNSKIYRNNGSGAFTEIGAGTLTEVAKGSIAFGDIDGDGDLDLIHTGAGSSRVSKIYQNDEAIVNVFPSLPENPHVEDVGGYWKISWDASADDHTSSNMMRYKTAIGSASDNDSYTSAVIDYPRGQANIGNVNNSGICSHQTKIPVWQNLWFRVGALDTSFKFSGFSSQAQGTPHPYLSWTGETDYTADGLHPESGDISDTYIYRVKYSASTAPQAGYPKVHILKGGAPLTGSPFEMTGTDAGDTNYSDGKIYSYTATFVEFGSDYTYCFEAYDTSAVAATGIPTSETAAPDIENTAPYFSWTGEANYETDGLDTETGSVNTTFVYRITFTDLENDLPEPGYPVVCIRIYSTHISGSPFTMDEADAGDTDCSDGKIYTFSKQLPLGINYRYYFGVMTTDPPAWITNSIVDAPDVLNTAPVIDWTGQSGYISDGLDPETGDISTTFVYCINYTDADDNAPQSGYPKVHILKGGTPLTGSPFEMTESDAGDTLYSDGKSYTYLKQLTTVGADYSYFFDAYDAFGDAASGSPCSSINAPDVIDNAPVLSWTGEAGYVLDGLEPEIGGILTNFVYSVIYTDIDNNAPLTGYPKVHIIKEGLTIGGSPFSMIPADAADLNYADGKIYEYITKLPSSGDDYEYIFEAFDDLGEAATGEPRAATLDAPDISTETKVFPNPLHPESSDIHFTGLVRRAIVTIYDVSGVIVADLMDSNTDGEITWTPAECASGIYFYTISDANGIKTGTLAVIKQLHPSCMCEVIKAVRCTKCEVLGGMNSEQ